MVGWDALRGACGAAARRHLPHLLREPDHQRHRGGPARRTPADEPPARAHRRVRGRRLDRAALLRRALPHRAQRRRISERAAPVPARDATSAATAAHPVRRPGRRAQGPAGAAARLRGAARPRAGDAHARRRRRRGGRAHDCSTIAACRRSARSPRSASWRSWRAPTCCARPRWAARASAWSSPRRSPRGTPVLASDIPGYRDVVRDGVDGLLVPAGDPLALAEALRRLALEPARRARMAARRARARRALRLAARRRRGARLLRAGDRASARPRRASGAASRCATASRPPTCCRAFPLSGCPRLKAQAPTPPGSDRARRVRTLRRLGLAGSSLLGVGLAALALQHIGVTRVAASLVASKPGLLARRPGADVRRDVRRARSPGTRSSSSPRPGGAPNVATRCRARSSAC